MDRASDTLDLGELSNMPLLMYDAGQTGNVRSGDTTSVLLPGLLPSASKEDDLFTNPDFYLERLMSASIDSSMPCPTLVTSVQHFTLFT